MDVRVLSIGGTGNFSCAVTQLLTQRGVDLTLLNRGRSHTPGDVRSIHADIRDGPAVAAALPNELFDVIIDWIAFTPEHVAERDALLDRIIARSA
jgi:nucleoside-diphosphate-sugar epimerase